LLVGVALTGMALVGVPMGWWERALTLATASAEPIRVNLLEEEPTRPIRPMTPPAQLPVLPREKTGPIRRVGAQESPKITEQPPLKIDELMIPNDLKGRVAPMVTETPKLPMPPIDMALPLEPQMLVPLPTTQPIQTAQPAPSLPPVNSGQPMPMIPLNLNLSLPLPPNTVNRNPMVPLNTDPQPEPPLKLELDPPGPDATPMPTPTPKETLPTPMADETSEPEPIAIPLASRGSPMTRTWKDYGLRTVLAASLITTMAVATTQAQDTTPMKDPIKEVDPAIANLRTELERITTIVKRLETFEQNLKDTAEKDTLAVGRMQTEMNSLKSKVDQLSKDLAALAVKFDASGKVVAKSSPVNEPLKVSAGRVLLKNDYLEEMTIIVNSTTYRVVPGQEMSVTVPAGTFSYQVPQLQNVVQSRNLKADETYTIRVHPQR